MAENFSLESLESTLSIFRRSRVWHLLRERFNGAESAELAIAYEPGMSAESWANALQANRPDEKKLTPEQLELLIEILKVVLQILILLG